MRGTKQAGLGKVGGKVGVGEFVHLRRLLPARLTYEPGKATTRVPSVAYGLGVIKRPSGACSALPRGRFVRGVLVRGEGSQTHPRITDYTVLCRSPRRRVTVYTALSRMVLFQAWAGIFTHIE